MMINSRRSLVALLMATAAPLFAVQLNADEQEKSQQGKLSAGDSATFVIDSAATADDGDAAAGLKAKSFVVIGKDGEKKVISSAGKSLSVTVNSSTSTEDNGDGPKTQVSGKMVIIGPDGEKKEYDLKDGFPDNIELPEGIELPPGIMLHMNEENDGESPMMLWRSIAGAQSGPRFMIGVMCEPAGEVLRSHLKLDGAGLVVESVSPDMPAVAAGIEKGDILLSAGDVKLKEVADLVKAVKDSEGKQIEFRVIKSGQESTVAVTPSQSTEKDVLNALGLGGDIKGMIDIDVEDFDMDVQGAANEAMMRGMLLRRFGPGIRLENEEAMKLDLEKIEDIRKSAMGAAAAGRKQRNSVGELQKELEALQKRLSSLEKQLKAEEGSNDD